MQAVKLRPEEALGAPVRSDWLLLWRLLLRGLPSKGDAGRKQRRHVRLIIIDSYLSKHSFIKESSMLTTNTANKHKSRYNMHEMFAFCRPLLGSVFGMCCPDGVEDAGWAASDVWAPAGFSLSPRLEEKTRSKEGSLSIHSTLDIGRQLKRIWEGCKKQTT